MRIMTKNKLVYGVGVNDADYNVYRYEWNGFQNKVIWKCPFYSRWSKMLARCYSEKIHKKYPSYIGCSVCDDWMIFSNFKRWMESQDWLGKEIDKDIFGSKIYSPETCLMVTPDLNKFFRDITSEKKSYGYSLSGNTYQARLVCKPLGVKVTKRFKTEFEASNFYFMKRREVAIELLVSEMGNEFALSLLEKIRWLND